jgi:outer membrane protein assembly factor BamA
LKHSRNFLLNLIFELLIVLFFSFQANGNKTDILVVKKDAQSQHYYVDKVFIFGNKRTKESIIRRELDFSEGDSIHSYKVDSLLKWERNKIFNTNLFVTVDVELEILDSLTKKVAIIVRVKEQWYTIPNPRFEFIDRNFNVWWREYNFDPKRVTFGLAMMQKNCRGRNETLRITLKTGYIHTYSVSYDIPYINKKQKLGVSIAAEYSQNLNLQYKTDSNKYIYSNFTSTEKGPAIQSFKTGLVWNYRNAFFTTHSLETTFNYNQISDTILSLNPYYFSNNSKYQRFFYLKYTFNHDKRDVKQFAQKGKLFKIEFEQLGFTNWESFQLSKLTLTYAQYFILNKHFLFAFKAKGKTSFPVVQPWTNFQALGSNKFDLVRGYEPFVMNGQHYFLWRNSLRFILYNKIWDVKRLIPIKQFNTIPIEANLTLFNDYGYVSQNVFPAYTPERNLTLVNTLLSSFGVGLNIITFYNSVLRLEYSYNANKSLQFNIGFETDI